MEAGAPPPSSGNQNFSVIAPFDPSKKKKKKKTVLNRRANGKIEFSRMKVFSYVVNKMKCNMSGHLQSEANDGDETALGLKCSWKGSDRDYGYEELLHRVYSILNENNPELAGDKKRTVMKPAHVLQEGTGRTLIINFTDLCHIMRRQPDHVRAFMEVEMGTSGYLDKQQRLVFRGRCASKDLERILRRYIDEYVLCSVCRSPDTILSKDGLFFSLGCNMCGCERSPAPVKAGHVAQTDCMKSGE